MPPFFAFLACCTFGTTLVIEGKANVLTVLSFAATTLWDGKASLAFLSFALALRTRVPFSLRILFTIGS
jgi:hypothetical protein